MSEPAPKKPRRRKRKLSARWLDYCERVDRKLNPSDQAPTVYGIALLFSAIFRWIGRKLFFDRIAEFFRRQENKVAQRRAETVDAKGFGKFTENLEGAAANAGFGLSSAFGWFYRLFVPQKLLTSIGNSIRNGASDTFRIIRFYWAKIARKIFPPWLRRRFAFLGTIFGPVWGFVSAWTKSRDWNKLAWSLPAALISIPLMGTVALSLVYSQQDKVRHYQLALNNAILERDGEAEALCLMRLDQLGSRSVDDLEYHAAYKLAEEEGKYEEAAARMRVLAPDDQPGHVFAHIWLGRHLALGKIDAPERWELVRRHAQSVLDQTTDRERDRESRDYARWMLGEAYARAGYSEAAIDQFDKASATYNQLHFQLLERHLYAQNMLKARDHAMQVLRYCRSECDRYAELDEREREEKNALEPVQYLMWAKAARVLEQGLEEQIKILEGGLVEHEGDEAIGERLSERLAELLARNGLTDESATSLAVRIFTLNSDSRTGMHVLIGGLDEHGRLVRDIAAELIQRNLLNDRQCLFMGDECWKRSKPVSALWYYERASELNPESAAAWNNVAHLRSQVEETIDMDRALAAANRAIEIDPVAACFETRGQIYVKLRRWAAAVSDLNRAINGGLTDERSAHRSLGEAYRELGDVAAAEAHSKKADL